MHPGLPCSRKKLESMALHEVLPQALLQHPPSLAETSYDEGPTCDDMRILFN
jgi:hypothetical protein